MTTNGGTFGKQAPSSISVDTSEHGIFKDIRSSQSPVQNGTLNGSPLGSLFPQAGEENFGRGSLDVISDRAPSSSPSRRGSLKDVQSRLHESTAAVRNSEWKEGSTSPVPEDGKSFRVLTGGDRRRSSLLMDPSPLPSMSHNPYEHVSSKLMSPTAAVRSGMWRTAAGDLSPRGSMQGSVVSSLHGDRPMNLFFSGGNRRRSMIIGEEPPPLPELPEDPYVTVPSRLHAPTAASTHAKWQSAAGDLSSSVPRRGRNSKPEFVTCFKPKPLSVLLAMAEEMKKAQPKRAEYDSVKSRLLAPTAAFLNSNRSPAATSQHQVVGSLPHDLREVAIQPPPPPLDKIAALSPSSRLLLPTESTRHSKWTPPGTPKEKSQTPRTPTKPTSPYSHVASRLHLSTAATERRKWVACPPPDTRETVPMAFGHPIEEEYRMLATPPRSGKLNSPNKDGTTAANKNVCIA